MFRVDRAAKIHMPAALQAMDPTFDYYPMVVLTLHIPIWTVRGLPRQEQGDPDAQRITVGMFCDVDEALHVAGLDFWEWVSVYVLLPGHVIGEPDMVLERCLAIDHCDERTDPDSPDELSPCLRVKTTHRAVLFSGAQTPLGEEVFREALWRDRS